MLTRSRKRKRVPDSVSGPPPFPTATTPPVPPPTRQPLPGPKRRHVRRRWEGVTATEFVGCVTDRCLPSEEFTKRLVDVLLDGSIPSEDEKIDALLPILLECTRKPRADEETKLAEKRAEGLFQRLLRTFAFGKASEASEEVSLEQAVLSLQSRDSTRLTRMLESQARLVVLPDAQRNLREFLVAMEMGAADEEDEGMTETHAELQRRADASMQKFSFGLMVGSLVDDVVGEFVTEEAEEEGESAEAVEEEVQAEVKKINLRLRNRDGDELVIQVRPSTPLGKLFAVYCKEKHYQQESVMFLFDNDRLYPNQNVAEVGLEDNDTIDVVDHQCGGKPVILFYPKEASVAIRSVTLQLSRDSWTIKVHYPKTTLSQDRSKLQWCNFRVQKGGKIIMGPSETHEYLFWESTVVDRLRFDFEPSEPILLVPRSMVSAVLERLLFQKKMHEKDVRDMITYWLGALEAQPWVLLQLMSLRRYENLVHLDVDPQPDAFVKIFLVFCGVASPESVKHVPNLVVDLGQVLALPNAENLGELDDKFVVYEWGGMDLHRSKVVKE